MTSPTQDASFVPFTKAEHIQQLNDIDKSITQLLRSAGLALQILTSSQDSNQSITERKQAFETATDTYLATLQSVDVHLKRQIWGLEEEHIIVEKKLKDVQDPQIGGIARPEKDFGESGTGKLDIGWLNSRSGKVGRDNEAELWKKARNFLEDLNGDLKTNGKANADGDQDMGM